MLAERIAQKIRPLRGRPIATNFEYAKRLRYACVGVGAA